MRGCVVVGASFRTIIEVLRTRHAPRISMTAHTIPVSTCCLAAFDEVDPDRLLGLAPWGLRPPARGWSVPAGTRR